MNEIILALINNAASVLLALATLVSVVASSIALKTSKKTKKDAESTSHQMACQVQEIHEKAEETKALAEHATVEMVEARENTRKIMHHFLDTDTFNAQISKPSPSGHPPLEPLSDPAPLSKD